MTSLERRGQPASVKEIRDDVAAELGGEVPRSSIQSYLQLNEGELFEKVGRGTYALREPEGDRYQPAGADHDAGTEYKLSDSWLIQRDCFKWMDDQAENVIEAVVTDPPYGIVEYSEIEQTKLRSRRGGVWRIPPSFDGHRRSPLPRFSILSTDDKRYISGFFREFAQRLLRIVVPGANVLIASNPLLSYLVAEAVVSAGFERRGEIVRLVMTMRGGDRPKNAHEEFDGVSVMPRAMWEPWLYFRKPLDGRVQDNLRKWRTGGFRRPNADQPFGDVIKSAPTRPNERAIAPHPSLKPQAFLRQIVRAVLPLGEGVVLDPFAGSGSTISAALAVGYRSIGVEVDPHYIEVARKAVIPLSQITVQL